MTVWATADLSVDDLRKRLQHTIERELREKGIRRALDWRRVWDTHCLMIPSPTQAPGNVPSVGHFMRGTRLLDMTKTLRECGVTEECALAFSPHVVKVKGHKRARHYRYQRPPTRSRHSGEEESTDGSESFREAKRGDRKEPKKRKESEEAESTSQRDQHFDSGDHRGYRSGHDDRYSSYKNKRPHESVSERENDKRKRRRR